MSMTGHPTPSSNPWNKILKMMEKANWTFGIVILTLLLFWWNFDDGSFKMLSLNYNLIPQLTASFGAETKHVAVVADFEGNFKDLIHMGAELMANLTYLGYSVKLVVTVEKSLGKSTTAVGRRDRRRT